MSEKRIELLLRRDQCELVLSALALWTKKLGEETLPGIAHHAAGRYTRDRINEVITYIEHRMPEKPVAP